MLILKNNLKYFAVAHALYAGVLQLIIASIAFAIGVVNNIFPINLLYIFSIWLGALFSYGFFISREYSQREGRLGVTGHAKPWEGLLGWDKKSIGDALAPIFIVTVIAIIVTWIKK